MEMYVLALRTNDGFRSMGYADINDLQEKIERFKFHSNSDYYILPTQLKLENARLITFFHITIL